MPEQYEQNPYRLKAVSAAAPLAQEPTSRTMPDGRDQTRAMAALALAMVYVGDQLGRLANRADQLR